MQAKAAQQSSGVVEVDSAYRDPQTIANALLAGVQVEDKHNYSNHRGSRTSYGTFQVRVALCCLKSICAPLQLFSMSRYAQGGPHTDALRTRVVLLRAVQIESLRDLRASVPPELEATLTDLCGRAQQYDALSPDARRALVAEVVPLLTGPLQR